MSRIRTNLVKPFNTTALTVENPSLIGTVRIQGKEVLLGGASSGQSIVYDGTRWVPGSGVGGASSLKQLTDVILSTDPDGNVIEPDGSMLVFNNDPDHPYDGMWTATDVVDAGAY